MLDLLCIFKFLLPIKRFHKKTLLCVTFRFALVHRLFRVRMINGEWRLLRVVTWPFEPTNIEGTSIFGQECALSSTQYTCAVLLRTVEKLKFDLLPLPPYLLNLTHCCFSFYFLTWKKKWLARKTFHVEQDHYRKKKTLSKLFLSDRNWRSSGWTVWMWNGWWK